jgi:hypothetical protein
MRRTTNRRSARYASTFRRVLTAVIVVVYAFVGFGGEISCAEEALVTGISLELSAASGKADEGSKQTPTVVDHCYTCVPITIPAAIQVSEPLGVFVDLSFASDTILLIEARLLDPPPPKTSI